MNSTENSKPKRNKIDTEKGLTEVLRFKRNIRDCFKILEQSRSIRPNMYHMGTIVNKAKDFAEAKEILEHFESKYPEVKVNFVILNTILNKAKDFAEAKEVLEHFESKYPGVKVNEVTQGTLVNKSENVEEAKEILNYFQDKYPHVRVDTVVMNTMLNKTQSFHQAKQVIDFFEKKYPDVRVDIKVLTSLYNIIIKKRKYGKVETQDLIYVETLINKLKKDEAGNLDIDFRYLIFKCTCFFAAGNHKTGVEILKKIIAKPGLNKKEIQKVTTVIYTFLPPNHPIHTIITDILEKSGQKEIIKNSEMDTRVFWDVLDRWSLEYNEEQKFRFSNPSVIYDLGAVGINSQARIGSSKKRKEQ